MMPLSCGRSIGARLLSIALALGAVGAPNSAYAQNDQSNAALPEAPGPALRNWQTRLLQAVEPAQAGEKMVVTGTEGWLFFVPELRHLGIGAFWGEAARNVSRATNPDWADPLPAIVDFHRQLNRAGIELLIVPVPAKAAIYPANLPEALRPEARVGRADADAARFYALLAEQDVPVLDLAPLMLRDMPPRPGPVYCRQDTHWSGVGCVLAAWALSDRIKTRPWYGAVDKSTYTSQWRQTPIDGDLRSMLDDDAVPREMLPLRFVQSADGRPIQPQRQSPVLLLGDSHTLIYHSVGDMHAAGAGLLEQLTYELGFVPDLVGVRGSGATPSRIALMRRGDNLQGKKLVIWVFSVREFTEGQGWRKVPVIR